jgi:hypothetical protein
MAHAYWLIRCPEVESCDRAYSPSCQFNSSPTDGTCRAAVGIQINKGHFGNTKLDGLTG